MYPTVLGSFFEIFLERTALFHAQTVNILLIMQSE